MHCSDGFLRLRRGGLFCRPAPMFFMEQSRARSHSILAGSRETGLESEAINADKVFRRQGFI